MIGCTLDGVLMGYESGHGTHVAGTLGGATFGVAKKANIYGIHAIHQERDATPISSAAAGMELVVQDAPQRHCPNQGSPKVRRRRVLLCLAFTVLVLLLLVTAAAIVLLVVLRPRDPSRSSSRSMPPSSSSSASRTPSRASSRGLSHCWLSQSTSTPPSSSSSVFGIPTRPRSATAALSSTMARSSPGPCPARRRRPRARRE